MIGDRIRDLRNRKRLSQTELAKLLHVSQQTVTKWETGKSEPSGSAINSIADYFNVSADWLLGRPTDSNDNLTENQKLVAYSIDPDISDDERKAIIEMVQAAKKFRRRI